MSNGSLPRSRRVWRTRRRQGIAGAGQPAGSATTAATPFEQLQGALARRLGCSSSALSSSSLDVRLQEARLPTDRSAQVATLYADLEAERFGGPSAADTQARLRQALGWLAESDPR